MAKTFLSARVNARQMAELKIANEGLGGDAADAVRRRADELSDDLANDVRAAAHASGRQSGLMARTVRGTGGQVTVGGPTLVGRNHKPAYKILFGSEFGAHIYKQFRPFERTGYWFFPTIEAKRRDIEDHLAGAADDAADEWDDSYPVSTYIDDVFEP